MEPYLLGARMILPDFKLVELVNRITRDEGLDTLGTCRDPDYWSKFPHSVEYRYNDRGFRDSNWPGDNLDQCIWCVGDSFTTGIGSPYLHTWPQVLQAATGRRVINVAMDGACNDWIAKKITAIMQEIQPRNLVVLWSYLHRRESPDASLTDLARRLHTTRTTYEEDTDNFFACVNRSVLPWKDQVIHGMIPKAGKPDQNWDVVRAHDPRYTELWLHTKFLGEIEQFDDARDRHHFDIVTSTVLVRRIMPLLDLG